VRPSECVLKLSLNFRAKIMHCLGEDRSVNLQGCLPFLRAVRVSVPSISHRTQEYTERSCKHAGRSSEHTRCLSKHTGRSSEHTRCLSKNTGRSSEYTGCSSKYTGVRMTATKPALHNT
jgi:hypothetical protein